MQRKDYKKLVDEAMLSVLRAALNESVSGKEINYFITFDVNAPGVVLSSSVKEKYPSEISIILQNQFNDLQVFCDKFTVVLSFSGKSEKISVPFHSLSYFLDRDCGFDIDFAFDDSSNFSEEDKKSTSGKIVDMRDRFSGK